MNGYYARLGNKANEYISVFYVVYGSCWVFIDGKLRKIPPLDEMETDLVEISEEKAFELAGVTELVYDKEYNEAYKLKLKKEISAERKKIKQYRCELRHQKNLLKKKK